MANPVFNVNDPIFLMATLYDRDPTKFVRARLFADGVEMAESPIDVPHFQQGIYQFYDPENLKFPSGVFALHVLYTTYNDVGYSDRSVRHAPGEDLYVLTRPSVIGLDPRLEQKLDDIINIVTAHDLNSGLDGFVDTPDTLVGEILPDEVDGFVDDDSELTGFVEDEELDGGLDPDSELDGTLQED